MDSLIVHRNRLETTAEQVSDHATDELRLTVERAWCFHSLPLFQDLSPPGAEAFEILLERFLIEFLAHRPHDDAPLVLGKDARGKLA